MKHKADDAQCFYFCNKSHEKAKTNYKFISMQVLCVLLIPLLCLGASLLSKNY